MTHPNAFQNMVPKAVLMRSGATRSITTALPKRSFQKNLSVSTAKVKVVSTANAKIYTAMSKVIIDTVVGNHFYVVKASAC